MIDISDPYRGNLLVLLPLIYILPSYGLHVFILVVMLCSAASKQFRSNSFYQLYMMSAVNNMVFGAVNYFKFRASNAAIFLPWYDAIPTRSVFLTVNECLLFHNTSSQALLDMFISFNRSSVFFLKNRYNNFWKSAIKIIAVFMLVAPAASWWHFWFTDMTKTYANASNPEQGYRIDQGQRENIPWMVSSRNMSIVIGFTSISSFLMNLYVVFKLRQKLRSTKGKISAEDKQDLKLFVYTVFVFVNQICSLMIQLVFYFTTEPGPRNFVIRAQHFVIDINTMAPPWVMILLSKNLRLAVLNRLFCGFLNMNSKKNKMPRFFDNRTVSSHTHSTLNEMRKTASITVATISTKIH